MAKHSILMVDDEQNVLKSLKRQFIDTDYSIFTAESGEQGLKICAKEKIALVISDYRMPRMNGVQFLAKVKEKYPDTIRIVLSGYADVSAIVEAINDGQVYKFLSKPWNDQELLTTIQRSLEHFDLQQENAVLLKELTTANSELKALTDNLERQVNERTRDLELKNRALDTAHRLLDVLPAGVLGIDDQGTIVYMNRALGKYVDTGQLAPGEALDQTLESGPLHWLRQALSDRQISCTVDDSAGGIRIVCAPLPDQAGVVGLFAFADLDRHKEQLTDEVAKTEVADVD